MLDKKRIREAEGNVRNYLRDGLLRKKNPDEKIINILRINSQESLKVADMLFREDISSLWVIVTSYYSMFYIANAVLSKHGYKVGDKISHKITNEALIVFVRHILEKSSWKIMKKQKERLWN